MSQVLSDPRMLDYLIQSQPQLQAMGPGIRQYMQSEEFRRTLADPQQLRNMLEMHRMFTQMGVQIPGMPAARQTNFPAPGVTNTTAPHQQQQQPARAAQQGQPNPFEAMFNPLHQTQQPPANPFISLFPGAQPTFGTAPAQQQLQQPQNQAHAQTQNHGAFGVAPAPMNGAPPPPVNAAAQAPPINAQPHPVAQYSVPVPRQQTQSQQPQPQQSAFGVSQQAPTQAPQQQQVDWNSMLQSLQTLNNMLGQAGVPNPMAGSAVPFPAPSVANPVDNRPLEERYQVPQSPLNFVLFQ